MPSRNNGNNFFSNGLNVLPTKKHYIIIVTREILAKISIYKFIWQNLIVAFHTMNNWVKLSRKFCAASAISISYLQASWIIPNQYMVGGGVLINMNSFKRNKKYAKLLLNIKICHHDHFWFNSFLMQNMMLWWPPRVNERIIHWHFVCRVEFWGIWWRRH